MSPALESTSRSQTDEVWSESCPAEETEPDQLLGSQETQVAQMETNHETIPPEGVRSREAGHTGRLKRWADRHGVPYAFLVGIIIAIAIGIGIGIGIGIDRFILSAKPCEPCPATPACAVAACPDGWVGYLGKCYYFSEAEANWNSSQSNCSALGASLAVIDTQQEMDFMRRYKGPSDCWIGLQREPGQPWKWTNGTEFNNWFKILGGELCAFMNEGDIASSRCSREGRWICSK